VCTIRPASTKKVVTLGSSPSGISEEAGSTIRGAGEPLGLDLLELVEQLGDAGVLAVAPGVEADQPERVVLDLPIADVAALAGR